MACIGRTSAEPFALFDCSVGKVGIVQDKHGRYFRGLAKFQRHRHVQLGWHPIRQVMDAESRLKRINSLRMMLSIS